MYIKEIELNNFRIYKGKNKISLLPSNEKNIIVVSGQNGFGKTTFLMSLVWCLYGKQMEQVDELYNKEIKDKGNYTKYIEECLNRKARENGEMEFSVSITFTDVKIPEITCNEVTIKRTYNVLSSNSDKVEVLIDGYANELIEDLTKDNQKGEEIFIRDFILPIAIAKFFFFDAEKIVSLAEINLNEQRKQLSRAYSEVLGIQKYEDLKATLEDKQDEYRRKSARPEEIKELNQLKTDIENKQLELKTTEFWIDDLTHKKNQKEKEVADIQIKLIREGDKMSLEELQNLKEKQQTLELKKSETQEQLKELFDLIPFALAGESLISVSEQLDKERKLSEQKFKQDDVSEKTNKIKQEIEIEKKKLDFVCDVKTEEFFKSQILLLVKKYFFSDTEDIDEDLQILHDFTDTQVRGFEQLIGTIKNSFKNSFSRLNTEYSSIKNQLDSINRQIREAEKSSENSYIASLRTKKEELDREIAEINERIAKQNQDIGEFGNQIKAFKQKQEILRKKIDDSTQYSDKEQKTKQLINKLQKFITQFKEQKKESLEDKMLNSLTTLLHKKDFIKKVVVDISFSSDDIDIILYNQNNHIIDKSSLSMGERQMYSSALLSSLVDESEIEFPVFIDSPMQKFDEKHAENIIKNFYPNVSKQVVIFPLINKELTEKEYGILQPNVCRAFLIKNTTTDSSEFLETTPDNFINTYNQIYNANY